MDKIDPDVELAGEQEYKLSKLGPKIVYKVLKTSHPGLKTSATEYISEMREDKSLWKSAEDAYIKPWRKEVYEALGIRPIDVLSDIKESLLVGEFVDNPMRHLILFAGMKSEEPEMLEFSYRDVPLEAVPYSENKAKRDKILKQYKLAVMRVCRETGVIAPKAIEVMNAYRGKPQGPVVLRPSDEAIREIRMAILKDPAAEVVNKIVRAIKLHNNEIGFTAFLRRSHCGEAVKHIDVNEDGTVTKIDINMLNLEASRPYVMTPGRNRAEVGNMKRLKLTEFFLNSLKDEI